MILGAERTGQGHFADGWGTDLGESGKPMMMNCRICGADFAVTPLDVPEMMFGSKEIFTYTLCADCGSLQIAEIPQDIGRYYSGAAYYSYRPAYASGIGHRLRQMRNAAYFSGANPIGRLMVKLAPALWTQVLASAGLRPEHRILDVGCGSGTLLEKLARIGFTRLAGVDPFVPDDMRTPAGVQIRKAAFLDVTDPWDVIMFNHSLEHVFDPVVELRHAARLLSPGGLCLVRIPTPSSAVWDLYGTDWVQLDAPRHIALPSRTGMARLADRAGFVLEQTIDDSWAFGVWGSELYRKGIALQSQDGQTVDPAAHFSREKLAEWSAFATAQNAISRGDQAAFVLRVAA